MATKTAEAEDQEQPPAEPADGPVLDMSDAAVKKLIKTAKARGYVTYDELNEVLPSDEVSSEQIEDTMSMLSDMGINVIETDEAEEGRPQGEERRRRCAPAVVPPQPDRQGRDRGKEPTSAPTIPCACICVRWARSSFLSREGEIAIAKRIEAGREAMIGGLCESPLTFQAIIIWRDELKDGKILLRDIIDLEATYQGPDAKPAAGRQPLPGEAPANGEARLPWQRQRSRPAACRRRSTKHAGRGGGGRGAAARGIRGGRRRLENTLSLAAMEAELKPKVLETFDQIATTTRSSASCRTRWSSAR